MLATISMVEKTNLSEWFGILCTKCAMVSSDWNVRGSQYILIEWV